MACKSCQNSPVWKFTNKRQLCSVCFVQYFEKKVKGTIRKYNMPIHSLDDKSVSGKVIDNILKNLPERKGRISVEDLNDMSIGILHIMVERNSRELKKLLPKNQPLYFLSDKEILLYAKLKEIKGKFKEREGKFKEIDEFIQKIEKKNPDIRHNIVMSLVNQ